MRKSLWEKKRKKLTEPGRAEEATGRRWQLSWASKREEFGKERGHLGQGRWDTQGYRALADAGKVRGAGAREGQKGGPPPCSAVCVLPGPTRAEGGEEGATSQRLLFRETRTAGQSRKDTPERWEDGTLVRGGRSGPGKRGSRLRLRRCLWER